MVTVIRTSKFTRKVEVHTGATVLNVNLPPEFATWTGTHPAICELGMLVIHSFVVNGRRWTMYKNAPWWPGLPLELLRYKTYFLPFPAPADLSKQLPQAILLPRTLALPPRHMHSVYRLPRHDQHLGEPSGRGAGKKGYVRAGGGRTSSREMY